MMSPLGTPPSTTPRNKYTHTLSFLRYALQRIKHFIVVVGDKKLGKPPSREAAVTALEMKCQIIFQSRESTLKFTGVQSERELGLDPKDQYSIKDLLWDLRKSFYLDVYLFILS